jgi:hypothetical protein
MSRLQGLRQVGTSIWEIPSLGLTQIAAYAAESANNPGFCQYLYRVVKVEKIAGYEHLLADLDLESMW